MQNESNILILYTLAAHTGALVQFRLTSESLCGNSQIYKLFTDLRVLPSLSRLLQLLRLIPVRQHSPLSCFFGFTVRDRGIPMMVQNQHYLCGADFFKCGYLKNKPVIQRKGYPTTLIYENKMLNSSRNYFLHDKWVFPKDASNFGGPNELLVFGSVLSWQTSYNLAALVH